MKTAFAILAAISFGGVGLNAQSVQVPGASASCVQKLDDKRPCPAPEQAPAACPVSMQATHLADGSFVKTDTAHPRGVGQWLSLALTDSDDKQIVKATLKVHGVKPNGHVTQALSGANGPDNITQTLTVPFPSEPYPECAHELMDSSGSARQFMGPRNERRGSDRSRIPGLQRRLNVECCRSPELLRRTGPKDADHQPVRGSDSRHTAFASKAQAKTREKIRS